MYTAALHDGRVRNGGRNSVDRRQVLQVMDGDLIWMTLITDAEGGRVNWMVGFVFWFAGWCLIVQFSPGGCLIVQVFCDAACRGLNRQTERLSPKDRAEQASCERRLVARWLAEKIILRKFEDGAKNWQCKFFLLLL